MMHAKFCHCASIHQHPATAQSGTGELCAWILLDLPKGCLESDSAVEAASCTINSPLDALQWWQQQRSSEQA
jgi:hypothetical protein